jgi:hypothetical protein
VEREISTNGNRGGNSSCLQLITDTHTG